MSKNTQLYTISPHFDWDNCNTYDILLNGKLMLNITYRQEAQDLVNFLNESISIENPIDASSVEEISLVKELQERIDITDSPKLKSLLENSLNRINKLQETIEIYESSILNLQFPPTGE